MKFSKNIFWLILIAAAVSVIIWGLNFWTGGCSSTQQESIATTVTTAATNTTNVTTTSTSNGTTTTITLPSYSSEFIYVATGLGLSSYNLNQANGRLTSVESIYEPGGSINFICVDPSSKFLFAGGVFMQNPPSSDFELQSFTIDPFSGTLSTPDVMVVSKSPLSAAFDPAGNFVYIGGGTDLISIYRFNTSTGGLTFAGSKEPGASSFLHVAVEPGGKYAYACGQYGSDGYVWAFNINSQTGDIAYIENKDMGPLTNPIRILMDPVGNFLYVEDYMLNNLLVYQIDQTTGKLTQIQTEGIGASIFYDLAIDPIGRFLYVAIGNAAAESVKVYRIDPTTGKLSLSETKDVPHVGSIAADPAGKYLCLMQANPNNIIVYRLDPSAGSLTLVDSLETSTVNSRPVIVGIK